MPTFEQFDGGLRVCAKTVFCYFCHFSISVSALFWALMSDLLPAACCCLLFLPLLFYCSLILLYLLFLFRFFRTFLLSALFSFEYSFIHPRKSR
jgi:hypothetical protein